MVSDSKSRDELDGHGSRKKVNMVKDTLVQSPGKLGRASNARQTAESPHGIRKSKRLEKEMTPSPPMKRTSERLVKSNTPNSLRRSDRGKKEPSPGSVSKESAEEPLSKLKRKKEKPVIQVTMESEKAEQPELDLEVVGMKREKMNARKFRALFKRQQIQEIVPDCGDDLEISEKPVDVCSDNSSKSISFQPMEDTEDVGDDGSTNEVSEGALPDSALRDYDADVENGIIVDAASASPVCRNFNLEGTCLLCFKSKRVRYDSPEQELCSCCPGGDDLVGIATCKARSDCGAAVTLESTVEFACGHPLTKRRADSHTDGAEKLCSLCSKNGDLLCCEGKSCMNCYHLYCLDPPLTDVPPGVWHCPQCVKKRLLFGVHSVSDGIESVWDVRELEVPNVKGVQQKQFLVKYRGLAHVHNHWVPEKQLLLENPCLVSNFLEKDQVAQWNADWMVPHRLLGKRPIQDNVYVASTTDIWACEYEWLVKWRCLNYDHATWELDTANFLVSTLGQDLRRNYEIRRGRAKKEANKPFPESIVRYSEFPGHLGETHILKNVNKLREFLFKCPNAVVFDDQIQEQTTTAILLVHSMIETFWPVLIVTSCDSLSRWEANFEQLVPSVDVVVYSGSSDTRNMIRASEFYDEGGQTIFQVLLSSVESLLEDLEILKIIKWKAIIFDEYQHSRIADEHERIKILSTDMRILLVSGPLKDVTSDYIKILSLVESDSDFDKLRTLKPETNDNLSKLKDRLSRFIAYGRPSQVSKFIEYWVPVQMSNLQLEHYCDTLLSNSNALCSYLRKDPFGVLPEILLTVRKCCHHPYLVDTSVQARLIADKLPANEILGIGIKASGKLQLLDVMLNEIKRQGLRVLILFQPIVLEPLTSGNILSDSVNRRFGLNTYERVDAAMAHFDKQAAVNRFNKKEAGQFVFLLENRACSSTIKLSSLDVVVIYDSDWNPVNDLKALRKISIDSKADQVKVFRLYSSFTIEERALVLAKQNVNLDHNPQNFSRSTSNNLLSWGATNIFRKLDEYHANSNSSVALNFSSGQSLLDEVTKEFHAILSEKFENIDSNFVISEAKLDGGSYSTNNLMFGESKVQLEDREVPHVFWKNLFEGKNPLWKHLKSPSPRNRKRVYYWEGSPSNPEAEKDNMANKRRKMVNESLGPTSSQVESVTAQATISDNGSYATKSCNQSENFHRDGQSSLCAEVTVSAASKEGTKSCDDQQSIHGVLLREMKTLCQNLKLPDNVNQVAELFLEYVIKNHHVSSSPTSIVQAFQISLCWVAASITKQKVDKKETLMLAKQLLDYQCTEEEASSVYSKMRSLKRLYLQCSDNITRLNRYCLLSEEDFSRGTSNANERELHCSSYLEESAEQEIGEKSANSQLKVGLKDKTGASETDNDEIKKIKKKCDKRMKKLIQEHQQKIQELKQTWEDKRVKLETDHKLECAFIRSIHGQASAGMDKLKLLNVKFKDKIKENNFLKDLQLKNLEAKNLAAINEERQKAADWLAKVKACSSELRVINGHQSLGSQSDDDAGNPKPSTCIKVGGDGDKCGQHLENNPNKSFSRQCSDLIPSISSTGAPVEAVCSETPVKELVTIDSEAELLDQSKNSVNNRQANPMKQPAPVEQVADEHPLVSETVPNETMGHDQPGELSCPLEEASNEVRKTSLSDNLMRQRSEPGVVASRCLQNSGQPSLCTEQTTVSQECRDILPQNDPDTQGEENRSSLEIEIAVSEPTDSVAPVPPYLESPITGNILTTKSSNKAPVDVVFGQLHSLSVDISLSRNQSPATGHNDQESSSSQTARPEGTEVLLSGSIPQTEEILELHSDRLNVGPSSVVANEQNAELPGRPIHAVPQNDMAVPQEVLSTSQQQNQILRENDVAFPQEVVSTSGQPNQAIPQVDIDSAPLHEPGSLLNPTHYPSWNSSPSSLPDPLQIEIDRIHREAEQLEKHHVEMIAKLKFDCEKEIEEMISQIRNKYEVKCKENEAEFRLNKDEIDKNKKKVALSKMLAAAFRLKCSEKPSGLPNMQQGTPSSMLPPSVRPSLGFSASQPARTLPTTTPAVPQLARSHPVRPSPVGIRNVTTHPIQLATAHVSSHSPRPPPVISAITPASLRAAGGVRSAAPHLQPCRPPTVGAPSSADTCSPAPQLRLPQVSPKPVQLPSQPGLLQNAWRMPSPGLVAQNTDDFRGLPHPPPGFTQQVLVADRQPYIPQNGNYPVPDIPSTFHPLEQSDLEMLGNNILGSQTSAAEPDVVCLSDDQ
ncbi:helicase protein MOM1-like [Salvia splendens]|uniref:helicase protein MOM1-like n=1 Tax=Salvia splendens TaxID=180675 RepID=UPI001C269EF6|nr:helicase protein MOM1-like [Salvia splendens]XP_042027977.1 helicase protein MOM1-like [Salvia splendens]XP_042027978.1 helicase protein MOM1-like [Salvia splendens]XP_042027979.1 helicase protein MOM1-like [Salvia splendens]